MRFENHMLYSFRIGLNIDECRLPCNSYFRLNVLCLHTIYTCSYELIYINFYMHCCSSEFFRTHLLYPSKNEHLHKKVSQFIIMSAVNHRIKSLCCCSYNNVNGRQKQELKFIQVCQLGVVFYFSVH